MSYPQPPQWGPQQGYYPPPPPQKSNTGKVILLLLLGGMCVVCAVPVVLSKSFRDGFREENERLSRVTEEQRSTPATLATDGGMVPMTAAQVRRVIPPDDSDLVDFPDNRRRSQTGSLADTPTALGHLGTPSSPGSTPRPEIGGRLRERFAGHCEGRGRRRRCPTWFVLLSGDPIDVSHDTSDALWVRVPTMIPSADASGSQAALNICNAARYETAAMLDAGSVSVQVFQWDPDAHCEQRPRRSVPLK